jgi:type IV pilus assembly protein PilY1
MPSGHQFQPRYPFAAALTMLALLTGAVAPASGHPAKVMLLVDHSEVMNLAVYHPDYDAAVVWPGTFERETPYRVTRTAAYTPRSFSRYWPNTPSATLVESDNGQDGVYPGNYLNWVYYHASAAQRAALPQQVRLQLLKWVLSDAVYNNPDLDFGLTIFAGNDGGRVVVRCGESWPLIISRLAGLTAYGGGAPLAEAAEDVLDEFRRGDAQAPFAEPGALGFCLVVAGGLPTWDLDVSAYLQDADGDHQDPGTCTSLGAPYPDTWECSSYLDDVTWYLAHTDLRPDLPGAQNVRTSVVGFLVDHPLLASAAVQGGGDYAPAANPQGLFEGVAAALAWIRGHLGDVADVPGMTSASARLYPACPNPFNPSTTVAFELAGSQEVRLTVHDPSGRLVATLADATFAPGRHEVIWNGRLKDRRAAPSGVYFFKLEAAGTLQVLKAALLK